MINQQPALSVHYDPEHDSWGIRASHPAAEPGPWISDQRWHIHTDAWLHKKKLIDAARGSQ